MHEPVAVTQDSLMQPVQYAGQEYFTSQYFHRQYIQSAGVRGKYREHKNFLRLLRHIEAYTMYVGKGDIAEIHWEDIKSIKSELTPNRSQWQPLFQATGYQPLTLLNATAQVALSHHLDDEISQQISVTANTMVARQEKQEELDRNWRNTHLQLVRGCWDLLKEIGLATEHDRQRVAQEVRFLLSDGQQAALPAANGPGYWTVEQRARFLKYPANLFLGDKWKKSLRIKIGIQASNAIYKATNARPEKVWKELDGQWMEVAKYLPEHLNYLDTAIQQVLGMP